MSRRHTSRTCPTCSRAFSRIELHTVCPLAPHIHAWLAQHLPDPDSPQYIIIQRAYEGLNPPINRGALLAHYGTWRGLADAFGLRSRIRERGSAVTQLDSEVAADLRRLADELHDGEFGPSTSEYDTYRRCAIMTHGLQHRHGTWADVLALAGLRVGSMSEYINAAHARRKTHQTQNARGTLDRGDEPISREYTGIPVMPEPRRTPTGGLIWTVR